MDLFSFIMLGCHHAHNSYSEGKEGDRNAIIEKTLLLLFDRRHIGIHLVTALTGHFVDVWVTQVGQHYHPQEGKRNLGPGHM